MEDTLVISAVQLLDETHRAEDSPPPLCGGYFPGYHPGAGQDCEKSEQVKGDFNAGQDLS